MLSEHLCHSKVVRSLRLKLHNYLRCYDSQTKVSKSVYNIYELQLHV